MIQPWVGRHRGWEGIVEFKDRYSHNTLMLQTKCCIWLKKHHVYLTAEENASTEQGLGWTCCIARSFTSMQCCELEEFEVGLCQKRAFHLAANVDCVWLFSRIQCWKSVSDPLLDILQIPTASLSFASRRNGLLSASFIESFSIFL